MQIRYYILFSFFVLVNTFIKANPYPGASFITYVHTDRNCYISGDNILLKGYHINTNGDLNNSEMALYIDIATRDSLFIKGEVFSLKNGVASGLIAIPDSLKTGEYILRAYTSHSLRYTDSEVLFSKTLFITNRFGNNGNKIKSDTPINIFDKSDSLTDVESEFLELDFNESTFGKRSLIKGVLKIDNVDSFTGSFAVKPITAYEKYYSLHAENITTKIRSQKINVSKTNELLIAESIGIVTKGHVIDQNTSEALANVIVFVAERGSVLKFKTAISDENGNFCFLFDQFYDEKETYISCYSKDGFLHLPNAAVEFDGKFLTQLSKHSVEYINDEYEKSFDTLNLQKAIINKAYKITNIDRSELDTIVKETYEQLYFIDKYDFSVNMDDYVVLNDFLEISREILPFVKIRDTKEGYKCSILDTRSNLTRENPLILIDGVPLNNLEQLLDWGSEKIQQIDLMFEPRYYGDIAFSNGMLFIWTRENDFWNVNDYPFNNRLSFQGFQLPFNIDFPTYTGTKSKQAPDFRQTLYWNADIEMHSNPTTEIDFYSSDETGWFEIIVEGVADHKHPVYVRKLIFIE